MIINALLPPKSGSRHPQPTGAGAGAGAGAAPKPCGTQGDLPTHASVTINRDTNATVTETLYEAGFLGEFLYSR